MILQGRSPALTNISFKKKNERLNAGIQMTAQTFMLHVRMDDDIKEQATVNATWAEANCVSDVDEPKNDNDERLVRAALGAQADIFVTGDRRILDWGERRRMKILNPRGTWTQFYAAKGEF